MIDNIKKFLSRFRTVGISQIAFDYYIDTQNYIREDKHYIYIPSMEVYLFRFLKTSI